MSIFTKNKELKIGATFPFIENKDGKVKLKYDSIKFYNTNDNVTITYMQGNVPIYAYTYNYSTGMEMTFSGMQGTVDIKFSTT